MIEGRGYGINPENPGEAAKLEGRLVENHGSRTRVTRIHAGPAGGSKDDHGLTNHDFPQTLYHRLPRNVSRAISARPNSSTSTALTGSASRNTIGERYHGPPVVSVTCRGGE